MSLQIEAIYGSDMLSIYNHNEYGNPHSQYISNNKDIAISPYIIDGKYYKLLRLEIEDLKKIREEKNSFNILKDELNRMKNSNVELSLILEKENQVQFEGYKEKVDYMSSFQVAFDVYESQYYGSYYDDKWELFLKITHSQEFYPQNAQVKLKGKEQRAILTVSESTRKEEYRYNEFAIVDNKISISDYKVREVEIPVFVYDLYILLEPSCQISFVKTFLNSSTANYEIYDKKSCVNFIGKTKEEKEELNEILQWNISMNNTEKFQDISKELDNDNENIVNKFISKTDQCNIIFPSVPNYFEKMIELFEVNIRFQDVYFSSHNSVWEVFINDGLGGIEFRQSDRTQYLENHKQSYIKFMIYAANGIGYDKDGILKYKYAFELEVLEYKNIQGNEIYVKADPGKGTFKVFILCDYPQHVQLQTSINNIQSGEYNTLRINQNNNYIGFLPANTTKISWDDPKYSYYEGID